VLGAETKPSFRAERGPSLIVLIVLMAKLAKLLKKGAMIDFPRPEMRE